MHRDMREQRTEGHGLLARERERAALALGGADGDADAVPTPTATATATPTGKKRRPALLLALVALLALLLICSLLPRSLLPLSLSPLLSFYPHTPSPAAQAPPAAENRFHLSPQLHTPRTPQLRTYDFRLGARVMAPDGVEKRVGMVNGLFPGPTIELRSGDLLRVTVHNDLDEPTSLHWHGLRHELELLLLLGDWYHRSAPATLAWYRSSRSRGDEPVPDNALLNGQQIYDCARSVRPIICDPALGTRPHYLLDPLAGGHRLRLVNTGSLAVMYFSVDAHLLKVVEADGTDVRPVVVKELPVAPGQRYSVILQPLEAPVRGASFWLRTRLDQSCFNYPNRALDPEPRAILSYGKTEVEPQTSKWLVSPEEEFDPLALRPADPAALALPEADEQVILYVNTESRASNGGVPTAYINQTSWVPDAANPFLARDYLSALQTGALSPRELVVRPRGTQNNTPPVLDIIINNFEAGPHPFHLHGHHFWPLYTYTARYGKGAYSFRFPPTLPTEAPALRDTFVVPAYGHAIFRVRLDTPGAWLFHCHVLVHQESGMAMTFLVDPENIPEHDRLAARQSCASQGREMQGTSWKEKIQAVVPELATVDRADPVAKRRWDQM
ncbi:multicopper oxidase [Calocera viscosa TUFC12733]|uniref:Multicopper oxidase n=1 Tax=Calocera viscosa (strain TUFC12733) TaxID=1330018 RepID=A0A167G7G9_CALVF|nr:multicopper oxidase [Calocera viscosa TUFC12733]